MPLKNISNKKIVTEVYASFVDTFFSDSQSLVTGALLQTVIVGTACYDTGNPIYLVLLLAILVVALMRLRQHKAYQISKLQASHLDYDERCRWASAWENRYISLGCAATSLIGLYAFIAMQIAPSAYSMLSATTLVFATLPTVVARLYGSQRLVSVIVMSLLGPAALGAVLYRDPAHVAIAILCLPYIFLMQSLVKNIRGSVLDAIQGRWKSQEIADRFDVALNNMSHGLIMFDGAMSVLVANKTARQLLDIPVNLPIEGRSFATLLRYAGKKGTFSDHMIAKMRRVIVPLIKEGGQNKRLQFPDGRCLEFTANLRAQSGTVLTFEDITGRLKAERQMTNMARYDALTGLPNRGYFATLIDERLKHGVDGRACALIMLDVDDFKHVNDTLGHAQGDALLRAVAARLKEFRTHTMMLSRQGGDEFMVFISEIAGEDQAVKIADALRTTLTGIYTLGNEQVHVATSIGVAVSERDDFEFTKMMVKADLALYRSKAMGKGMWSVFEDSMDDDYRRRQHLKNELAKAVENDELKVRYQPIVDAVDGKLAACEALSRWSHPELGDVSPAEYIPLAEEMGIIGKLSRSVLRTAMSDCAQWPNGVNVSINLSAIDFRRNRLLEEIDHALATSGLEPHRVEIEVTETAVISNEQEMLNVLNTIRDRGIKISLDDFGTGYSSLSYLHRLPLDKVKIDRSFVEGIESGKTPLSMLRGITSLCKTLGLQVTIEGVSSSDQLNLVLATEGVSRIQGFVLGPALPPSSIQELARRTMLPLSAQPETASIAV